MQTRKRFKKKLFIRPEHNLQFFGVIPFIKPQNNTYMVKKMMKNEMEAKLKLN